MPGRSKLLPACGYMGSKRRCAPAIVDRLLSHDPPLIYDVGCGSGAITLELLSRGYPAKQIMCIESGPWGAFWLAVTLGELKLDVVNDYFTKIDQMPLHEVKYWVENVVAKQSPTPENFLVMQSASIGAVATWHTDSGWVQPRNPTYTARPVWVPPTGSREKSPRGTVFTPLKIVERVQAIAKAGYGLRVIHGRVEECSFFEPGVIYIDPPYSSFNTSGYRDSMDVRGTITRACGPVYVSEGSALEGTIEAWALAGRKGAAINGKDRSGRGEEWLNRFRA